MTRQKLVISLCHPLTICVTPVFCFSQLQDACEAGVELNQKFTPDINPSHAGMTPLALASALNKYDHVEVNPSPVIIDRVYRPSINPSIAHLIACLVEIDRNKHQINDILSSTLRRKRISVECTSDVVMVPYRYINKWTFFDVVMNAGGRKCGRQYAMSLLLPFCYV